MLIGMAPEPAGKLKRPSKAQWAEQRALWEADPTLTHGDVAEALGVSRAAATKQAKGWVRIQSLAELADNAYREADRRAAEKVAEKVAATSEVAPPVTKAQAAPPIDTMALAVAVRASILEAHRGDWEQHRELFTLQAIADEFEQGKSAKISAEMLQIRQKGERDAYGLDKGATEPATPAAGAPDNNTARVIAYALHLGLKATNDGQGPAPRQAAS